jgi:hypothetical protein
MYDLHINYETFPASQQLGTARGSAVGIVTRPLAGGGWKHGSNPGRVKTFFSTLKASIPAAKPTHPPIQWEKDDLSPRVKRRQCEID